MDSLSNMSKALVYIEEHLTDNIDYSEVSKIACCSEYPFKRMFSFLSGISLSEYVRRRRLTLAVLDLKNNNLRIEASTWVVFESIGPFPETLQNVWGRIYSEWFPSSEYEVTAGPEILWKESPDTGNPEYRSEIDSS